MDKNESWGKSRKEKRQEAIAAWDSMSIEEHMEYYENQGIAHKEAMKLVAKDRGMKKRDVYQYLLNAGKEALE